MMVSNRILRIIPTFFIGLFCLGYAIPASAQEGADPETLQQGAILYLENCAVCHGPEGEGRVGATLAKDWPSIRPDLQVKTTIENGVPGSVMPAWSQQNGGPLSADEIEALVAYILTWESGEPFQIITPPPVTPRPTIASLPEVEGDPNQGVVIYDQNCAVCHGANGEGRVGVALAQNWPSIRPDLRVKASISNGVPGSPMPAWSQEQGGPLMEEDIDNLVAFIMSWPALPSEPDAQQPLPTGIPVPGLGAWAGILLTISLFILIVGIVLLVQKRR